MTNAVEMLTRVAAIYDVHGNLPALEAVLREAELSKVDAFVFGGDVLPGPMPRETLNALRDLHAPVHFIRGNGERAVLALRQGDAATSLPEQARPSAQWVAGQLSERDERFLAAWPEFVRLHIAGLGRVLFCHATPRNDSEIFTYSTPEERLLPIFTAVQADLVVCGHTHMQFDRQVGGIRVINAGSVGMPFGKPGAYWALLGSIVELRRTEYNLADAAALVRQTSYPAAEEFASGNILSPPTEDEALALFASAELR